MKHRVREAILLSALVFIVAVLAFPAEGVATPAMGVASPTAGVALSTAGGASPAAPQASGGRQSSAQGGSVDRSDPTVGASFDEQELRNAPGARDVWALLEHWMPTVISRRLDVGGSATGT